MQIRTLALLATAVAAADFAQAQPAAPALTLAVDAREAPRGLFHARLSISGVSGPVTLVYPEWIPGEHGPTGPIVQLAGLRLEAGGKAVAWTRDPVDMFAFHCEVAPG